MIAYTKKIRLFPYTLGYMCFYDNKHPLAHKTGRVYYHRHVASIKAGRWLSRDEVVHHIDGDRQNNAPDNLRITSASKHSRAHGYARGYGFKRIKCLQCKKIFVTTKVGRQYCSIRCSHAHSRKVKRPGRKYLKRLVWKYPSTEVAKMFGVSDTSIKKWCKWYSIEKPGLGYWAKISSLL